MFDFSFGELALLAVVALVVLGPEKLPHTMRMLGAWIGRIRRTVISIQSEIEKEVAAQEMRQRIEAEMARMRDSDVVKDLKEDVDAINASLHEAQSHAQDSLHTGNTILPASPVIEEKPGEEAFKAHVQSSHARAEAQAAEPAATPPVTASVPDTPADAKPETESKPTP